MAADPGHGDHVEDTQGQEPGENQPGPLKDLDVRVIVVDSEVCPYNSGGDITSICLLNKQQKRGEERRGEERRGEERRGEERRGEERRGEERRGEERRGEERRGEERRGEERRGEERRGEERRGEERRGEERRGEERRGESDLVKISEEQPKTLI
ncbi:hypothetical protein DUI87_16154 [Hirundo rustica rustica]|uniref:Uncharacterized protein n=1 Tax=Hirundo rustica rustica TaxID=333673 RepID=A0A3M0K2T3_HIRRU|nr:hypothetical protein DUI87_16154 [Hirundo rustica rustica]